MIEKVGVYCRLSDEDRDNKKTYTSLMKDNIELLRRGTE